MLEALNNLVLSAAGFLLGWMVRLPMDAQLVVLALATGSLLTFVRLVTTNQDLLRRCAADKLRLKEMIRQAKAARDKEALGRHRAVVAEIGMMTMRAEMKPLLASIIPVAVLAVWAFATLGYRPPSGGEPVEVQARFEPSAAGQLAHLVPADGMDAPAGWVRRIARDEGPSPAGGEAVASWTVSASARPEPYRLEIRHAGRTYTKELLVDSRRYSPPLEVYDGPMVSAELMMRRYLPFGVVPGIERIYFDPWLVGYLLMAIPFVFILKRIFRIC